MLGCVCGDSQKRSGWQENDSRSSKPAPRTSAVFRSYKAENKRFGTRHNRLSEIKKRHHKVAAFQVPQSSSLALGRFTTVNLSLGWLYFRQPYRKASVFILHSTPASTFSPVSTCSSSSCNIPTCSALFMPACPSVNYLHRLRCPIRMKTSGDSAGKPYFRNGTLLDIFGNEDTEP